MEPWRDREGRVHALWNHNALLGLGCGELWNHNASGRTGSARREARWPVPDRTPAPVTGPRTPSRTPHTPSCLVPHPERAPHTRSTACSALRWVCGLSFAHLAGGDRQVVPDVGRGRRLATAVAFAPSLPSLVVCSRP